MSGAAATTLRVFGPDLEIARPIFAVTGERPYPAGPVGHATGPMGRVNGPTGHIARLIGPPSGLTEAVP